MGTRLKALTQNFKMVHAILQILHLLFSLKMTSQELLRKTQTFKTQKKKPVQPLLGGFGRHYEYGVYVHDTLLPRAIHKAF